MQYLAAKSTYPTQVDCKIQRTALQSTLRDSAELNRFTSVPVSSCFSTHSAKATANAMPSSDSTLPFKGFTTLRLASYCNCRLWRALKSGSVKPCLNDAEATTALL